MNSEELKYYRDIELKKLISYDKVDRYPSLQEKKAKHLMNSYYRLCGLSETNLYLSNDEKTCNLQSTADSELREEEWVKRLSREFEKNYGFMLKYISYYPSICTTDEKGYIEQVIHPYFPDKRPRYK